MGLDGVCRFGSGSVGLGLWVWIWAGSSGPGFVGFAGLVGLELGLWTCGWACGSGCGLRSGCVLGFGFVGPDMGL
jgi:hypothetical protein